MFNSIYILIHIDSDGRGVWTPGCHIVTAQTMSALIGLDRWVTGDMSSLHFEVEGTPCVVSPLLFRR